jgi:PAS domain S-box-containing protein
MSDNPIKVLVIEDDRTFARTVLRILTRAPDASFECAHSETLDAGLDLMGATGFDVILLDLNLPDSSGFDTVARTRARAGDAPIVVLTGAYDPDLASRILSFGAAEYFYKPNVAAESLTMALRFAIDRARIRKKLVESEELYRTLVETSADSIGITDLEGKIIRANQQTALQHGYESVEEMVGLNAFDLIAPEEIARAAEGMGELLETGATRRVEMEMLRKDGGRFTAEYSASVIRDREGDPRAFVGVSRDITERKEAEEALRLSERKYSTIFRSSPSGIVITTFSDGRILEVNDSLSQITGYSIEESIGRRSIDIGFWISADDRETVTRLLRDEGMFRDLEISFRRRSGDIGYGLFSSEIVDIRDEKCIVTVVADITARKRAEADLRKSRERLRNLSHRLVQVQEEERRRVARELHDEIGQALTGLGMKLEVAHGARSKKATIGECLDLVSDLMERVRDLSLDLRPAMLDDLGLVPTLLWLFDRHASQTGLSVSFVQTGLDRRPERPEVETAAFRIVQEALTNVARHANTNRAFVTLSSDGRNLQVEIRDEGRGFDPEEVMSRKDAVGLSGMRERTTLLNGSLTIDSAPEAGTSVIAELPLRPATSVPPA